MAKGCFERVLGIDAADKKALEYINLIESGNDYMILNPPEKLKFH